MSTQASGGRWGGLLGKVAFDADMRQQGFCAEEIDLLWEDYLAAKDEPIEYGSEAYIMMRLMEQTGATIYEADEMLNSFQWASSAGQTLH